MKKFIKLLMVYLIVLAGTISISAKEGDWPTFAGNNSNSKTTYAKTATSADDIEAIVVKQSSTKTSASFKDSIIVNDLIYTVEAGNPAYLKAFDFNGNEKKSIKLSSSVGFFSRIVYDGKGTIYVNLAKQVEAVDIVNDEVKWVSEDKNKQMLSTLVYYDGYLYGGAVTKASAGTTPSDGFYFAIDTNAPLKDGVKPYSWTWGFEDEQEKGFYWDGAVIVKDMIVFCGDAGVLVAHDLKQDKIYDIQDLATLFEENPQPHKVRSTINYDVKTDSLLIGTQNSKKLFKIKIENKKFDMNGAKSVDNPDQISGGIATSDSFIYTPSGGMYANAFSILDKNLIVKYTTQSYGTQSYPLVNTAYDGYEYAYFIDYKTGKLVISKYDGANDPNLEVYDNADFKTYSSSSVIANKYGDLITSKNDGGPLHILKNKKGDYNKEELEALVDRLPASITYEDKDQLEFIKEKLSDLSITLDNQAKLDSLVNQYNTDSTDKVEEVENLIDSIPATFSDLATANTVKEINEKFNSLNIEDQAKVSNRAKLDQALELIKTNNISDPVEEFTLMMNRIPEISKITIAQETIISNISAYYDAMSNQDKDKVSQDLKDKLNQANQRIVALKDAQTKAAEWNAKIEALPAPTTLPFEEIVNVKPVLEEYATLSNDIKLFITTQNNSKVTQLNTRIVNLEKAHVVEEKIIALVEVGNVKTKAEIDEIYSVNTEYNALTTLVKNMVSVDSKNKLTALKKEADELVSKYQVVSIDATSYQFNQKLSSYYGKSVNENKLPKKVKAKLSNNEEIEFNVKWTLDGYVQGEAKTYTAKGLISLTDKYFFENDGLKNIELSVEVVNNVIKTIKDYKNEYTLDSSVKYDNIINKKLVQTIKVENDFNEEINAKVVWTIDNFEQGKVIKYDAKGTIEAPIGHTFDNQALANIEAKIQIVESVYATKVLDFLPAPGQFVNEAGWGMKTEDVVGEIGNSGVSLGSFGGYVVMGFDKPIYNGENNPYGVDFTVFGNAFNGSEEPGSIMVMKDTNGNGLPDDEWYELAGSRYYEDTTKHNYEVAYTNPKDFAAVPWLDNLGNSGFIKTNTYHKHNYYPEYENYKNLTNNPNYTDENMKLSGNLIDIKKPNYGYFDVNANKKIDNASQASNPYAKTKDTNSAGGDGFDLNWAVDKNGNPVYLDRVDFVKAYTSVQMDGGMLGEVSAEVVGVAKAQSDNQVKDTKAPDKIDIKSEGKVLNYTYNKDVTKYDAKLLGASSIKLSIDSDAQNIFVNDKRYTEEMEINIAGEKTLRIVVQDDINNPKIYLINIAGGKEVTSVSVDQSVVRLDVAKTKQIKASVSPNDASDKTLKYTSDNKSIASVDANGKITAHKAGQATISVESSNGKVAKVKVIVSNAKNRVVSSGNTKYYQVLENNKYRTYKKVATSSNKATTTLYKAVNKKNLITSVKTTQKYKNKNILISSNSRSYYKNGKVSLNVTVKRNLKNQRTLSSKLKYNSNGKKVYYIKYAYKNNKATTRYEYRYNKIGQLKSNKYGKAYRYVTSYNKKGKAVKTIRKQYTSKGKLSVKYYIVKKRLGF